MFKSLFRKKKVQNVIFIALDGVRLDQVREFTHFKPLLSQGTVFPNMMTYSPHSIASFHAIFSGVYGSRSGVNSYFGTPHFKKEECKTLPQYLQDAGYYCLGDSMNELVIPPQGFDKLVVQKEFTEYIDDHKQLIEQVSEKNKEGIPCFLHLHCSYVHNDVVHGIIKEFKGRYDEYHGKHEENTKRYGEYLKRIDEYLQTVIGELKSRNLWDDSIIVFFSDHGNSLGEKPGEVAYGNLCYDYSLRTFAIFVNSKYPVKEVSNVIRNVDLMPTILDKLGISVNEDKMRLDGRSLKPFFESEDVRPRYAFAETGGMTGPYPSPRAPNVHCIRTDTWKLIFNAQPGTYELYNLVEDPAEEHNLIGQRPEKEAELKYLLKKEMS